MYETGGIATSDGSFCLLTFVDIVVVRLESMLKGTVAFGHHVVGIVQAKRASRNAMLGFEVESQLVRDIER